MTMFSYVVVILLVGVGVTMADTQVLNSFPVKPSTIIENEPVVDNSIYTDRFQNFYEDVDGNILAPSPTDDVSRYLFAGYE